MKVEELPTEREREAARQLIAILESMPHADRVATLRRLQERLDGEAKFDALTITMQFLEQDGQTRRGKK